MLFIKRFSFTLIASLGLAGSAFAAPINLDLANPELLAETVYNTFVQDANASEIDLTPINQSYGIQVNGGSFNFLKNETVKTGLSPVILPEPSSMMLLGLGMIGLTVLRRRKP